MYLRLALGYVFVIILSVSISGCFPRFAEEGIGVKQRNHTPEDFSKKIVSIKSSTLHSTNYDINDYNPDHDPDLFILETRWSSPWWHGQFEIKAFIIVDGVRYKMRHAIQEGSVPGEGIWTLKLPPSDYKRNDAGHFYYFSVEYLDGMSHAPKTLRLGSSNEPFIVKVPADP